MKRDLLANHREIHAMYWFCLPIRSHRSLYTPDFHTGSSLQERSTKDTRQQSDRAANDRCD